LAHGLLLASKARRILKRWFIRVCSRFTK